jgi:hypothetical protein
MDDVGPLGEERRDLGPELAREKPRELLVDDLDLGLERGHRGHEVAPRVLAPGVVLVEPGDRPDLGRTLEQVAGGGDVVHDRGRRHAEDVVVARLLEHPRRAAVDEDGELAHLLRHLRDRQAVAARDVAEHQVDAAPLDEVAELGDLLGRPSRLVDEERHDARSGEAGRVVGRRHRAGVEGVDDELGAVARRDAEMDRTRPGQVGHHGDRDLALLGARLAGAAARHCEGGEQRDRACAHAAITGNPHPSSPCCRTPSTSSSTVMSPSAVHEKTWRTSRYHTATV